MVGLGDASACGTNPCGLWDYVYASDACLAYKLCATPNDPATILESQGLIAGTGTVLGQTTTTTAENVVSGMVLNSDGTPNLVGIVVLGIIGLLLMKQL